MAKRLDMDRIATALGGTRRGTVEAKGGVFGAQALAAEVTVRRKRGGVRRAISAMKSAEADLAAEVGAGGMSRKRFADIRYYVLALERAAIAVGEERERGRQAKRKSAGTCTRCGMMKAKHGVTAAQSGACTGFVSAPSTPEPRR